MAKQLITIAEEDLPILKEMIRGFKQFRKNSPFQPQPKNTLQSADSYILYAHEEIPAAEQHGTGTGTGTGTGPGENWEPGTLECEVYKIVEFESDPPELVPQGFAKIVYNIKPTPVPKGFFIANKDKYGRWVVGGSEGSQECENTVTLDNPVGTGSGSAAPSDEGGEEPIQTEWTNEDGNCVELLLQTRTLYKEDGDEILYAFRRLFKFSADGKTLLSIGPEVRDTVDVPESC